MDSFERYSLIWILGLIAAFASFYLIRAFIGYRSVAGDAVSDYDYKQGQNMLPAGIDKDGYIRAYKRFYAPRNHLYIGLAIMASALLTMPALGLFQYISMFFWERSGRPPIYAPHGFVWQFLQFFSMIGFWGLCAYVGGRLYHRRAPKTLRDEFLKEASGT